MPSLSCVIHSDFPTIALECANKGASLIPDAALPALIAIAGSALTLLLANRHNQKLQKQKLDSDAREADKARTISLRKEVYIPALSASVRACTILSKYCDPHKDDAELGAEMTALIDCLHTVAAVGRAETMAISLECSAKLGEAVIDLLPFRAQLVGAQAKITVLEAWSAKNIAAQDVFIAEARRKPSDALTQQELQEQRRQLDAFQEERDSIAAQRAAAASLQRRAIEGAATTILGKLHVLTPLVPKLVSALRSDMGVAEDAAEVERIYTKYAQQSIQALQNTIAAVQKIFAEAGIHETAQ